MLTCRSIGGVKGNTLVYSVGFSITPRLAN
jgi:hypothetical protein